MRVSVCLCVCVCVLYVCGGALQGVVVQDDDVEMGQLAVAGGDGGHLVAGEVQTHQGQ